MGSHPRCVALVGPSQSGKTQLFEALLERAGKSTARISGHGTDTRANSMSMEANVGRLSYLGEDFTLVDCPGSPDFVHASLPILGACDVAIVVCEPDERKFPTLEVVLRGLEERAVPHLLFVNKIDTATQGLRETLAALQGLSRVPLLMRQIPIWKDGTATGFIDLALERAYVYHDHAPSERIDLPAGELPREKESRFGMLEKLADHDDALMEQLVEEVEPARERIMADLAHELRSGQAMSVLIGSALRMNGLNRLLKALRHEAPSLKETRARLGLPDEGPPVARVLLTRHSGFGGKISVARVLRGSFHEGDTVLTPSGNAMRIAGLVAPEGGHNERIASASEGETVGFAKLDQIGTGTCFSTEAADLPDAPSLPPPVYATVIRVSDRKDDVRLAGALAKLVDEDPGLSVEHNPELEEIRLHGQGEMHVRAALGRLAERFGVAVEPDKPKVGYRETIRKSATGHGRHKKQTGGHGQFADVKIAVRPLSRGEGFLFEDEVVGGTVPRKFIPSVETGARAYVRRGPLGFPVEDIAVTLTDGSAHAVDSSDAAFQAAARLALEDALAQAESVLLEPVLAVEITTPSSATAKATSLVSGRRGQILGYEARTGWPGWDVLNALIPESEASDLIVELRSLSAGLGSFTTRFDHMAELTGRQAEQVLVGR